MSDPEKSEANGKASDPAPVPAAEPSEPSAAAPSDEKPTEESNPDEKTSEAVTADGPTKKKKKKKKRSADDVPKREELDAEGRERPTFVLTFPADPALDYAVKAFELGDYATVRTEAGKLAEHPNEAVRAAAGELLRRVEPDPLVKVLLAMAVLLFLVVTFWAYRTHGVH
jgi:hypothetical protein